MKRNTTFIASGALALLAGLTTGAQGDMTVGATSAGFISGVTGNTSFAGGDVGFWNGGDNNGYRVFNLPTLAPNEVVVSAFYRFFYTDYFSSNNWEQINTYSYEGSTASLLSGTAGISGYNDLGSGTSYGGFTFNPGGPPALDTWVDFYMGSAVSDINANLGNQWAFGLSLSTYNGGATEAIRFGPGSPGMHLLVLETAFIPAPGALALLGVAGCIRRRRRC